MPESASTQTIAVTESQRDAARGSLTQPELAGGVTWFDTVSDVTRWEAYDGGGYLEKLVRQPLQKYVANADCALRVLLVDGKLVPVTLNVGPANRCRLTSLQAHFLDAAEELLTKSKLPRAQRIGLGALLSFLRAVSRLDDAVLVNNWLLTTNLHPSLSAGEIQRVTAFLTRHFPEKAIVYCGVNTREHRDVLTECRSCGFLPLVCRQILFLNKEQYASKRQYRRDLKWWAQQAKYRWVLEDRELSDPTAMRIHELFHGLYLHRHSPFNPGYTLDFFRMAAQTGFWETWTLQDARNQIHSTTSIRRAGNTMTNPCNGYDLSASKEEGLYTAIRLKTIRQAEQDGCELHMSSASLEHKRLRGGEPYLEYFLACYQHLPLGARLFWRGFSQLCERLFVPMVVKLNV